MIKLSALDGKELNAGMVCEHHEQPSINLALSDGRQGKT